MAIRRVVVVGALVFLLAGVAAVTAADGPPIFALTDPRGDDHGDGSLIYPVRDDLAAGDLDLMTFAAYAQPGGTMFEAVFARLIRPPGRRTIDQVGMTLDRLAKFGFYTFNIDVYVDIDRKPGVGSTVMLPGRRATIRPESAWEKAICLTPRPYEAREALKSILERESTAEIRRRQGRIDAADKAKIAADVAHDVASDVFFPTLVWVNGNRVRFFVPASFLGGVAKDTWSYVVAVSFADINQSFDLAGALDRSRKPVGNLFIVPLGSGRGEDHVGGGQEDDDLQAPLIDILVPPGISQEAVLKDYNLASGRPIQLPGVVPAEVKK
jgi:hypothetical protein